jgi:hypothetical protein
MVTTSVHASGKRRSLRPLHEDGAVPNEQLQPTPNRSAALRAFVATRRS